jgi:hypothetical protein
MDPVRIKLYGLITVTRRGYIARLAVGLVLAVGLLAVWYWLPAPNLSPEVIEESRFLAVSVWLLTYLPWVVFGAVALGAIEAAVVFRRLAREEALQRTLLDELSSTP